MRNLDDRIQTIVKTYAKSSAWHAHPELLLQAMLVSDDITLRDFAVTQIIKTRQGADLGDTSVRSFHVPEINMAASTLTDLIEWNNPANKIYEPLLTCHLTKNELIDRISNKMNVFYNIYKKVTNLVTF